MYSYENAQKLLPPELLLLAQICTRLFVSWDFAPDPTGGAYSAPQTTSWFRGWGHRGKGMREGREGVPECPNPELASLLCTHNLIYMQLNCIPYTLSYE